MKTVFTSREIAHVWANASAPAGRCPANMRFDGDAFYSYATVIARRIRARGKTAFVLDCYTFSSSTTKHQSFVRRAIKDEEKIFRVYCGERGQYLRFTPATLRDYYLDQFNEQREPSGYAHKRAGNLLHKFSQLESAIEVCEFFGMGCLLLHRKLINAQGELLAAREVIRAHVAKLDESRSKRDATKRANRERLEQQRALEDKELIELWIAGATPITRHYWPTLLRIEQRDATCMAEVVSTKGARVPMAEALRAFTFAMSKRETGWHRNGEQFAVGMYQLDKVDSEGVTAGCHKFTWAELERFGKVAGWII